MALTCEAVCREVDAYKYSKEFYEIMKECAEIEVMGAYMECQRYADENPAYVHQINESYEGYMIESASQEELTLLEGTIKEKAKGVVDKVWGFAKRVWSAFCHILGRLVYKVRSWVDPLGAIASYLTKNTDKINGAAEVALKAAKDHNLNLVMETSKKSSPKNPVVQTDVGRSLSPELKYALAAAIDTDGFVAVIRTGAMGINDIVRFGSALGVIDVNSADAATNLKTLMTSFKHTLESPAILPVKESELQDIVKKAEELGGKLGNNANNPNGQVGDSDQSAPSSDMPKNLAVAYQLFNGAVSETIKVINDFMQFRSQVVKNLNEYVKESSKKKEDGENK